MRIFMNKVGIAVVVWACAMAGAAEARIALVEADWLKANLDRPDIRIVDVSGKDDVYGKGHIPGAVQVRRHLDLGDTGAPVPTLYPNREQFTKLMERLAITPEATVVVYDDSKSLYATRMLFIMELYGHDTGKLKLLNGGSVRWKSLGYPMSATRETPAATSYAVTGTRMDRRLSKEEVLRDVVLNAKPGTALLDARPAPEYKGENIRSIRGGHIPKAVNVTGADAMTKEHTLRPLDEVRNMFEAAGFTPDKSIYVYCHSGDRSAHAYIILRHFLGYENVRSYDGSWIEWSTNLALPAAGQVWVWDAKKDAKSKN